MAEAGLGSDVRVAVRRIGNRSVDDPGDAGLGQRRHALAGIQDLRLQSVQILGPQHVGEARRDAVEPHRRGLPLVRPEDEPVAFLAEVVRRIRVAEERELGVARCELRQLIGDEVLV